MDKNTIWAVVLSTVVIIASYMLLPMIFPSMRPTPDAVPTEVSIEEPVELSDQLAEAENTVAVEEEAETEEESVSEQTFTVKTDKAEIVLSNKGGDIISYKLMDHLDMDTDTGVQLSDNISELNRTCAVAFGNVDSRIINDLFTTEKLDEYTYLFKKNVVVNGKRITLGKKYTFKPGEYVFKLDILMHSADGTGLDLNGTSYTIRTAPQLGPHYNPKQNRYENRQYVTYNGNKYKRTILGAGQFKKNDRDSIWTGIAGKYFVELIIPAAPETINGTYYSSKVEVNDYSNAQAFAERKSFTGSDIQDTYYMYFGPRDDKELKRYNIGANNGWGLDGKKLTECLQTSGWLNWLETILKFFMKLLYKVIPNWGLTIIVMTLILKIVMFPLSKKQSLGTLKMQELQPKMQALQEKYKNDQQKLQQETSKLYQEAGYNPASGCLPMIFQFLILFAMYNLFNNYFEFRGALFIPKWIPDLSTGDSVYTLKFDIPLMGNQIRILPVIYVASQLLSGKITQYGQTGAGQNQATMKFMMYGMPIMFFFMFYNAPAGLLLYWLTSNILQMIQQIFINKLMAEKKAEMASGKTTQKKLPPKAKRK
ncbi:MAG: membrane protein insertase YidC [Treponema sp.]|uniref:membrane protein insertase YidC n=1 Tax=Treponema sp. TaxID=166 RepID=UPI00298D9FD4|nr:membrane protein insertase YidC [Treponema sp.]MCQ2601435.1 membrane protein insertase YidC [Treponema sp.]